MSRFAEAWLADALALLLCALSVTVFVAVAWLTI
jgi:hypothetical protein